MAPNIDDTFAELMSQASSKGDVPGFSQSARSILSALTADDDNDFSLVQTVLADSGLTQRVLRLANSAMYAVFGGEVTTVSRAIQVLGVQTVAHLALGLKVIEAVDRNRPDSAATLNEMHKSVTAGFLGRQLAGGASLKDAETASVCAILQGLGRMMVSFYLPQAWARIQALLEDGVGEEGAVSQILGGQFSDIGQRMAVHWGLPETLTNALQPRTPAPGAKPESHEEWLSMLATASSRGARLLREETGEPDEVLGGLVETFSHALGLDSAAMLGALKTAKAAADEHFAEEPGALARPIPESEARAQLLRGFQELQTAAKTSSLSQMLSLVLEYLHSNLRAKRSFAFLRFPKDKRYRARYALGEGTTSLMPELQFDDRFLPDLIHAVLAKDKALFLDNAKADNLKGKLPMWWLSTLGTAQSLCIVPLHMNHAPVGFLYLDWSGAMLAPKMDETRMQILAQVREILVGCVSRPASAVPA